ncbi:MAG: hypothetical protein EWM73_01132 [Nitrospira sp.]|nr:MAG: hypothetical protein EWM73_01132 [Nitrospira sp.]
MKSVPRPFRRYPLHSSVTYNAGPSQGPDTLWYLARSGWRPSGNLPMQPGQKLSLTVPLPTEQRIEVPKAVMQWSGQEFAGEDVVIEPLTHAPVQHEVK